MSQIVTDRTRSPALAGALAMAPFLPAYAPFALVIGSTVATLDTPLAGWAGSWLIYGGSAHLAALHGVADGAAALAVVTALVVNARLLVYGASMAPRWRGQPLWFRAIAPALLVDPTWALAERHSDSDPAPEAHRHFFLAAGLLLGAGWSAMIGVGALLGDRLPHLGLDVAAPLCLIALVGPRLHDRRHRRAAVTGAAVALVGVTWPAGMGIAAAVAAGSLAAHLAPGERA